MPELLWSGFRLLLRGRLLYSCSCPAQGWRSWVQGWSWLWGRESLRPAIGNTGQEALQRWRVSSGLPLDPWLPEPACSSALHPAAALAAEIHASHKMFPLQSMEGSHSVLEVSHVCRMVECYSWWGLEVATASSPWALGDLYSHCSVWFQRTRLEHRAHRLQFL